jgi:hypothetical protein
VKRFLLVLTVALVMAAMLVVSATSVFAAGPPATDGIQQFRSMKECKQLSTVPQQCRPDR